MGLPVVFSYILTSGVDWLVYWPYTLKNQSLVFTIDKKPISEQKGVYTFGSKCTLLDISVHKSDVLSQKSLNAKKIDF